MEKQEAVNRLNELLVAWESWDVNNDSEFRKLTEALRIAVDDLKFQIECDENRPLTIEELRGMKGDPVFLSGGLGWKICYGLSEIDGILHMKVGRTALISMVDYGGSFFAYRYNPKE